MSSARRYLTYGFLLAILGARLVSAQGTWMMSNRTHPELQWYTLDTEHFAIHYSRGLEHTARQTAHIAEAVYPVMLDQLRMEAFGTIHITLTAEDEIMNGYAMPSDQIFIWVRQDQAAGRFSGSERWLPLVVAHELQHVLLLRKLHTWLGIWNQAFVPMWFIEGTAEYYTEHWRVGRSDARMKIYTYRDMMNRLDAHDAGYAKVLYFAREYGDSALVKLAGWRQPGWGYFDFRRAFRAAAGTSVREFTEDWRRAMNTYYYSYRGQKEGVEDVGRILPAPGIKYVDDLAFAPDSSALAIVGRKSGTMQYQNIYYRGTKKGARFRSVLAGRFDGAPAWTPGGQHVVISQYHRGAHGSLVYDLRKVEVATGKTTWLTHNMRAHRPVVTGDGRSVFFVADPGGQPNLYRVDLTGRGLRQVTRFTGEVAVNDPAISPAGDRMALMVQDSTGNVDIAVMDTSGQHFNKVTHDPGVDLLPVWSRDGRWIIFTSFRNSTPNLYRISAGGGETLYQMTDVTGGVFSRQRMPGSADILATSLPDVDTTRLVLVDPGRTVGSAPLVLREQYRNWRVKQPEPSLRNISYDRPLPSGWRTHRYRPWRDPRHLGSLVLPTPIGLGGFTAWNDPLGKRFLLAGGVVDYPPFSRGVLNHYLLVYNTTAFRPVVTMGILKHAAFLLQPYDQGLLVESRTGGFVQGILSLNAGNSLYSNHRLHAGLYLWDTDTSFLGDPAGERPAPVSGETGIAALGYRWLFRKPDAGNAVFPTQGMGMIMQAALANKAFFGQYSYTQWKLDAFVNQKIYGPAVLYLRGACSAISGTYPPQNRPALTNDISLYANGKVPGYLLPQPLVETRENVNLRGSGVVLTGNRLVYLTAELRLSLLSGLPVNLFGLRAGRISAVPYTDSGIIRTPEGNRRITTAGGEIRMAVDYGGLTLFQLGYGWGKTLAGPGTGREWQSFLRLSAVNPF